MDYAKNYERCCLEETNAFQRWFVGLLARKAQQLGQTSHKIWSLKWVLDEFFPSRTNLTVLDCGAWNGWFLSYKSPAIRKRIALDFDAHYAKELREQGIDFILSDMERGFIPLAENSIDLLAMTSTLEHLGCPEKIATELRRVLKPGGIVFITVPDIMKYGFRFWNDITHKRPFTRDAMRFLFETHGMETLELCPYNHNLFVAGNLFPRGMHRFLMRFRGDAILYVGRKPGA
ncbi:MAG: class I SAM-dependent methyltransferase [Candidatus Hydrogenedentes bacterium]|nr:class I SAM-dependent methyltransferase [Candidatus Hydrogenedentota bacterium]